MAPAPCHTRHRMTADATRTLLIALAVVLLTGCGGGDSTETTATANLCCEPEHLGLPCTEPRFDGTPVSVVCSNPPTPTPGGTPPRGQLGCRCVLRFELPTPGDDDPSICVSLTGTPPGPYVCPTPTPTP